MRTKRLHAWTAGTLIGLGSVFAHAGGQTQADLASLGLSRSSEQAMTYAHDVNGVIVTIRLNPQQTNKIQDFLDSLQDDPLLSYKTARQTLDAWNVPADAPTLDGSRWFKADRDLLLLTDAGRKAVPGIIIGDPFGRSLARQAQAAAARAEQAQAAALEAAKARMQGVISQQPNFDGSTNRAALAALTMGIQLPAAASAPTIQGLIYLHAQSLGDTALTDAALAEHARSAQQAMAYGDAARRAGDDALKAASWAKTLSIIGGAVAVLDGAWDLFRGFKGKVSNPRETIVIGGIKMSVGTAIIALSALLSNPEAVALVGIAGATVLLGVFIYQHRHEIMDLYRYVKSFLTP